MPSKDHDMNTPSTAQRQSTMNSASPEASASSGGSSSGQAEAPVRVKRPRGRPRVEARNQTPAEIRRTQVRLAQRSYRSRRENKIAILEGKITTLESVIRSANACVQTVHDLALKSGLGDFNPLFLQELTMAANTISTSAREALKDAAVADPPRKSKTVKEKRSPPASSQPPIAPNGSVDTIASTGKRGLPLALGYELVPPPGSDQTRQSSTQDLHSDSVSHSSNPPSLTSYDAAFDDFDGIEEIVRLQPPPISQWPVDDPYATPDFSLMKGLDIFPWDFSPMNGGFFGESSFGRYFHKACLTAALNIIRQHEHKPELLVQKLGYPLRFLSLREIEQRIKLRLSKPNTESLDSVFPWPPDSECDLPSQRIIVHPDGTRSQIDQGPWLRPDDVEEYFIANGVRIDPNLQYVECETDGILPSTSSISVLDSTPPESMYPEFDAHFGFDFASGTAFPRETAGSMPWLQGEQSARRNQKKVTIDVQKLVAELVEASTCRGRTPKITRWDVNKAFENSVVSVAAA